MARPVSTHRIRTAADGSTEYLCVHYECMTFKPANAFDKVPRKIPVHSWCKACRSRTRSAARLARPDLEERKAREREYQRQRRIRLNKEAADADELYQQHLRAPKQRLFVKATMPRLWLDQLVVKYGEHAIVEHLTGVQVRVQHRIANKRSEMVSFEVADRLATNTENNHQFAKLDVYRIGGVGRGYVLCERPVVERPGWSRAGHTCCIDCGTCWHPHQARGRCTMCYSIWRGHTATIPRDQRTGWTKHWSACVICNRTDRSHQGRGLCYVCRRIVIEQGTLHSYPTAGQMNKKPRQPQLVGGGATDGASVGISPRPRLTLLGDSQLASGESYTTNNKPVKAIPALA